MHHAPRSGKTFAVGEHETYVLGFAPSFTATADLEGAAALLTVVRIQGPRGVRTLALLAQTPLAGQFGPDVARRLLIAGQAQLKHDAPGPWHAYVMDARGVVHAPGERALQPIEISRQPLASMEALVTMEPGAVVLWRAHTSTIDLHGLPPLMVGSRATIKYGAAEAAVTIYASAEGRVGVKRDLICAWHCVEDQFAMPVLMPHPFAATEWFTCGDGGAFYGDDGVSRLEIRAG